MNQLKTGRHDARVAHDLVTGVAYPLLVTGIAQVVFPAQANGSLIVRDGKAVGSSLIGQPFDDPKYFWGRLSATAPHGYNAGASSRIQPGTAESRLSTPRPRPGSTPCARPTPATRRPCPSTS